MIGYDDFEPRLEPALRRYGDQTLPHFDAGAIAERAVDGSRVRPAWRPLLVPALLFGLLLVGPPTSPSPVRIRSRCLERSLYSPVGQGRRTAALSDYAITEVVRPRHRIRKAAAIPTHPPA